MSLARLVGQGMASGMHFLGATLLLLAAWMAGISLAFGVSWLTIIDRVGEGFWQGRRLRPREARYQARRRGRQGAQAGACGGREGRAEESRHPRAAAHRSRPTPIVEKSERVEKERQVPLFETVKSGETAAAEPAGRSAAA